MQLILKLSGIHWQGEMYKSSMTPSCCSTGITYYEKPWAWASWK
jgi:hypothetical protein